MKLTKEQLKQIIKEELESLVNEDSESKTYEPKDVHAAVEAKAIQPGEKFQALLTNYDPKTKRTYQVKKPAVYIGNEGSEIPEGTKDHTIVYYKKSNGEISSQYFKSMKSASRMDQEFRAYPQNPDQSQPYTKDDLDKMR